MTQPGMNSTLPIIVEHDSALSDLDRATHEEALSAAFNHFKNIRSSVSLLEGWKNFKEWENSEQHRKVVRRAKPKDFSKLSKLPDVVESRFPLGRGRGTLSMLSLPPHVSENPDASIKRLQVSGLDLRRESNGRLVIPSLVSYPENPMLYRHVVLFFDKDAALSTGKMIAQSSHAAQYMLKEASRITEGHVPAVLPRATAFGVSTEDFANNNFEQHLPQGWRMVAEFPVIDAGLTEVSENTKTVVAVEIATS